MKIILTYHHTRNLFTKNKFQSFVNKYFEDVKYLGAQSGNYFPQISIQLENWNKVKYQLPKYAIPIKTKLHPESLLDALVHGQLGLARQRRHENEDIGYTKIRVRRGM